MKTLFKLLTLLLALLAPTLSYALEGDDNVEPNLRRKQFCFRYGATATGASPSADPGTASVLATQALNSGPASYTITTFNVMPYMARVGVVINDVNNNDTNLACASLQISGRDQFGVARTETLIPTETAQYSRYVYSTLTSVVATTCLDSTDATDTLMLFTSQYAGLGANIKRTRDVEAACMYDSSSSNSMECAVNTTLLTAVNTTNDTVDLLTSNLFDSVALAVGDHICLRVLPSY